MAEAIADDLAAAKRRRSKTSPTALRRADRRATYFGRLTERAPAILGTEIDMESYSRFWRSTAPGVLDGRAKIRELRPRAAARLAHQQREGVRRALAHDVPARAVRRGRRLEPRRHAQAGRGIYELTCSHGHRARQAVIDDNLDNVQAAGLRHGGRALRRRPWGARRIEAILGAASA